MKDIFKKIKKNLLKKYFLYYNQSVGILKKFKTRRSAAAVAGLAAIALTIQFTSCSETPTVPSPSLSPSSSPSTRLFVCEHGTARKGNAPAKNMQVCIDCDAGYILRIDASNAAVCVPANDLDDAAPANDSDDTAPIGNPDSDPDDGQGKDSTAAADTCPDASNAETDPACIADIDDDNDGLIEIWTLEQLHNMRYDLAGTSYKTSSAAAPNRTGAPTSPTADCPTPTAGVYLCGYELAQNLDFDLDGDGSTYTETTPGVYTLDDGDAAAPYFVPRDGGWEPIGTSAYGSRFSGTFDGNGFVIANMAVTREQFYIGLFGRTHDAVIRNVGLVNVLAHYNGAGAVAPKDAGVGGLAGRVWDSSIIASYTTGLVDGDTSDGAAGGLVGDQISSSITASYSAAAVTSADNYDSWINIGGLVGYQSNGPITASYATGDVYGGHADSTRAGGLVGYLYSGVITASYATGDVHGGSGGNGRAGGLVGYATARPSYAGQLLADIQGEITASYATGTVRGGTGGGSYAGSLLGHLNNWEQPVRIFASYGFGAVENNPAGGMSPMPVGVTSAAQLTAATGGELWNDAGNNTLNAWAFDTGKAPLLQYADYDGSGTAYSCSQLPSSIDCGPNGDLLFGQP